MGRGAFDYQRAQDNFITKEIELDYRGKKDPNNPPPRKPGDKQVILGFVLGLIAGSLIGYVLGFLVIGAIVGAISGAYVPALVRKFKAYQRRKSRGE